MSSVRFILITLLLALLLMNRLASPRAVDSGSKIDKGECVYSIGVLTVIYSGGLEIRVHMNVVLRSTMNTNGGTEN